MRTGNVPSISDKDFADLREKIEKSVNKRIKDTETGQREILKMIENLSSKIVSLTDKTSCDLNQGLNGVNSENVILENRPIELNEFQQDVSQHMNNTFLLSNMTTHWFSDQEVIGDVLYLLKHLFRRFWQVSLST